MSDICPVVIDELKKMLEYIPADEILFRRPDYTPISNVEMIQLLEAQDPLAMDFVSLLHGVAINTLRVRVKNYSEDYLTELAKTPEKLIELITSGKLQTVDLTYAAETLGSARKDDASIRVVLVSLLFHKDAPIRESAIYGLSNHVSAGVKEILKVIAATDTSNAVRNAAKDLLED